MWLPSLPLGLTLLLRPVLLLLKLSNHLVSLFKFLLEISNETILFLILIKQIRHLLVLCILACSRSSGLKWSLILDTQFGFEMLLKGESHDLESTSSEVLPKVFLGLNAVSLAIGTPIGLVGPSRSIGVPA